jgi:pSer/pThr/pTyr-binding forkhead associated (FHA) protein
LQDAGSRNGVFVNGVRVTGHKALKVGDSITIAQHTFELRWQDDDASTPPARAREAGRVESKPAPSRDRKTLPPTPANGEPHRSTAAGATGAEPSARRRWYWPFS